MQRRREFIQMGGLGLLGLFTHRPIDYEEIIPAIAGKDKSLDNWSNILDEFNLDPELSYLNNGTMGPSPKVVTQAIKDRMDLINRIGKYGGGEKECLNAIARLVKAKPEEIALTHNVTEGINIAAWGLSLKADDEVLLSTHEHVGNGGPWLNLARLKGVKIKAMDYGKTAEETLEILKKSVTSKTRVIAIPHIPCTIGVVAPIKQICTWAKSQNIMTVIDGAHGTGMLDLDLPDIGCDVYISCCHKWLLGPKGTGYMYVSKGFQKQLESIFSGAYSVADWKISKDESSIAGLVDNAHKYHWGTQNSALFYGITEAVAFQESLGIKRIEKRVRELNCLLFDEVKKIKNLEILTPEEESSRGGVLSIRFTKSPNKDFYSHCAEKRIMLRYVAESDLDCVRISTHIYNLESDVAKVVKEIHAWA